MKTRIFLRITVAAALIALIAAPTARAHQIPHKPFKTMTLEQKEAFQLKVIRHDKQVLRFYRNHRFLFGKSHHALIARIDRRFHESQWEWTAKELKKTRAAIARRDNPRDYASAVRLVERFYGPQPFLWSCPKSEGGFGEWVWNNSDGRGPYPLSRYPYKPAGSSGAGGWLQFMRSTFDSVILDAIADARRRGMRIPPGTSHWTSPLGQALAGIEMLRDGRRGEWMGYTC